jgi:hypothetical protein
MASIQKNEERRTAEAWQAQKESTYVVAQLRNQLYRLV